MELDYVKKNGRIYFSLYEGTRKAYYIPLMEKNALKEIERARTVRCIGLILEKKRTAEELEEIKDLLRRKGYYFWKIREGIVDNRNDEIKLGSRIMLLVPYRSSQHRSFFNFSEDMQKIAQRLGENHLISYPIKSPFTSFFKQEGIYYDLSLDKQGKHLDSRQLKTIKEVFKLPLQESRNKEVVLLLGATPPTLRLNENVSKRRGNQLLAL